jgi:predicted transcriptional regulator
MSTTSFQLDEDLQEKLESTATRLKRTTGWLINEAVRQYIEREELELRCCSRQKKRSPILKLGALSQELRC